MTMKTFWVFSGQGAQAVGMGRDLYEHSEAARRIFDTADKVLGYSLSDICFNGPAEQLTCTRVCQVAIYTMSCAALEAYKEAFPEEKPIACAGLSLGEYAALYAAGAFDFVDGLKLLQQRAAFMDEACAETNGTMASVLGGDAEVIAQVCKNCDIDVANYNCPGQIVISGEKDKVAQAMAELKEKGFRKVIELNVAGSFHSRLMLGAGEKLKTVLASANISMPEVPVYHNISAAPAASTAELRANLAAQVAGSVRWEKSVRSIIASGGERMVEFGPGTVLTGLLRRTDSNVAYVNINSVSGIEALKQEG